MERTMTPRRHRYILECALVCGVAAAFLWGAMAQHSQQALSDKVVRLHILANSDSEEDQALKLQVRDQVLVLAADLLEQSGDRNAAAKTLQTALPELKSAAEAVIRAEGYTYAVRAELEVTAFPTKEYDGFRLPAGEYLALRIVIGAGEGHNWWCVVFPPLCTTAGTGTMDAAMAGGFTEDDWNLVTESDEGYVLKFKAVELWNRLKELWG